MSTQHFTGKFSLGVGDRFAHQAAPQLKACILAAQAGVEVIPVWNKSNREHNIVGSLPASVRAAAEAAVSESRWDKPFHIDADHITLETVDRFIDSSDFFTIDVASAIGQSSTTEEIDDFAKRHTELVSRLDLSSGERLTISEAMLRQSAAKFLRAAREAGKIYRRIKSLKAGAPFIAEVSMDETESPQSPGDLAVILAALADEKIPLWSIAPKFTGRFNKGVDYIGDVTEFEKQFRTDLDVLSWAISSYGFPSELKLSVHSGSDKFSLYPVIHRALRETGAGIHVKTAGTTWLEELIGLAEAGGAGLALAKEIYREAFAHQEELCAPYASVIDIDATRLPTVTTVERWGADAYVHALRHDPSCPDYNPSVRQLLHVGYKIAAKMGERYLHMLDECKATISKNVTTNLFDRHIKPLFLGEYAGRIPRSSHS